MRFPSQRGPVRIDSHKGVHVPASCRTLLAGTCEKLDAVLNMPRIVRAFRTSHPPSGWLKARACQ